jgi:hypothetical protein
MRIQSLGHKLRTGVLSLALLSSPAPLTKAAETLGGEANLLTKCIADAGFSKSNITETATAYWDDLAEQQSAAMKTSLKNNVGPGRISDILNPQKSIPSCVALIRETPKSKIYKIPTDSAAAISDGFNGVQDKFLKINIAVPKNKPSATFNDCTILLEKKADAYTTGNKYLDTLRRTVLLKGNDFAYVDSAVAKRPEGVYYSNGYYEPRKIAGENKTFDFCVFENSLGAFNPIKSYLKLDQYGKHDATAAEFKLEKDAILQKFKEVIPPRLLNRKNIVEDLSDPLYLPRGVKYTDETDEYKKFEIDITTLNWLNKQTNIETQIDTTNIEKTFLILPKESSDFSPGEYIIEARHKPTKLSSPQNGFIHSTTLLRDGFVPVRFDSIYAEDKNFRYKQTIMTVIRDNQSVCKRMEMPKAEAPSDARFLFEYTLDDEGTIKPISQKEYQDLESEFKEIFQLILKK